MKRKKSFKHSSKLRDEAAMVRLRIAHGATGYGIYFMLMEHLYQFGKPLNPAELDLLAYEFHVTEAELRSVVQDFGLFVLTNEGYIPLGEQTQVEQVSRPATPEESPEDQPTEDQPTEKTEPTEPTPIIDMVEEISADKMLMDELYDDIGDSHALHRIIDNIIEECEESGHSYPDRRALLNAIRARISEHLIDHPKPVYKRREFI